MTSLTWIGHINSIILTQKPFKLIIVSRIRQVTIFDRLLKLIKIEKQL